MKNSFIINRKLPSLNEYIAKCRIHAQKGGEFKREWQEIVCYEIIRAQQKNRLRAVNKAVVVHFYYEECTEKRDLDNVASFAHKVILDALVQMSILPNDTQRWIRGFTDTFYKGKVDRIGIELEEVEDNAL